MGGGGVPRQIHVYNGLRFFLLKDYLIASVSYGQD